jgi:TRAP-type C4-dicarboxylate transport system substrate-binding protein
MWVQPDNLAHPAVEMTKMYVRRTLATILGALFAIAGVTATSDASAKNEITIGTLAPKKSPWGKVFNAWAKAIKKKSNGELKLRWYYNGAQGDEGAMIDKMKSGQLDGAAVTSVGLNKINRNFLALQLPGLCRTWKCVDRVRDGVGMQLYKDSLEKGFVLLGKGDVGLARTFSKGKPIRTPSDLKAMKVYQWDQDPVAPTIASIIGYTGVKSSVPALLPALSSGRINVATVPPLAATQLQWANHFDHVSDGVAAGVIGGLIVAKSAVDGLPADSKKLLINTGEKAGIMLTKRIRKEDAKAYKLVQKRMTVVKLSAGEEAAWKEVFRKIRKQLGQGTFSPEYVTKLEGLAR